MSVMKTTLLWLALFVSVVSLLAAVAWNAALYGDWTKGLASTVFAVVVWELVRWIAVRREQRT